jgi:hypothetical protein
MMAPKLDRYGLHALDCECLRCTAGYRPTARQRENARRVFEAAEARKKAEREAAAKAAGGKAAKVRLSQWERDEAGRKQTDAILRRLAAPVVRPATTEELAELKKLWGFGPGGKDGKR